MNLQIFFGHQSSGFMVDIFSIFNSQGCILLQKIFKIPFCTSLLDPVIRIIRPIQEMFGGLYKTPTLAARYLEDNGYRYLFYR